MNMVLVMKSGTSPRITALPLSVIHAQADAAAKRAKG